MDNVLQYKYITLLGAELDSFKCVRANLWNFHCPICGDSQRNRNKKRGYIYLKNNEYRFHCHNCGKDTAFKYFLQEVSPNLYHEYKQEVLFDKIKKTPDPKPEQFKQSKKNIKSISSFLTPLSKLDKFHKAIEYVQSRKIPEPVWNRIFWTEHFTELIRDQFGDKYEGRNIPDVGIVFVIYSADSKIVGYQLRSIDKNISKAQRFITCLENNECGLYGIETIDKNKQIYVTEGAIDSLFIPNCIAVLTSALYRVPKDFYEKAIFINDCEPRNAEIVKQIKRCIDLGLNTVLLPKQYDSLDINDIVLKYNLSQEELLTLLNKNTFKGLEAKIKFAKWKLW